MWDVVGKVISYGCLLTCAVYMVYYIFRNDKKYRQEARESELAQKVDELTLELSRQGLFMHRKNRYFMEETIEVSRCGEWNNHFKIRVPSLNIEVEGDWFEDAIDKVNQAIGDYYDTKQVQLVKRCQHCKNCVQDSWLGFTCSKGHISQGKLPEECASHEEGEPRKLEPGEGDGETNDSESLASPKC